jgi:hypothetical protein
MGSGSPREWVFVQKCLLERKRSYLTEKGLFSRKACGDRGFESASLQRRVACEPEFSGVHRIDPDPFRVSNSFLGIHAP